jgi:hypothetical protein
MVTNWVSRADSIYVFIGWWTTTTSESNRFRLPNVYLMAWFVCLCESDSTHARLPSSVRPHTLIELVCSIYTRRERGRLYSSSSAFKSTISRITYTHILYVYHVKTQTPASIDSINQLSANSATAYIYILQTCHIPQLLTDHSCTAVDRLLLSSRRW